VFRLENRAELLDLYRGFYRQQPFEARHDLPRGGRLRQYKPTHGQRRRGHESCWRRPDADERRGRIVVFSVLDSTARAAPRSVSRT
jgi:hypothetical protein